MPQSNSTIDSTQALADELEDRLTREHGPLLSGSALRQALGFRSAEAFRQAVAQGTVPVPVFNLDNRRGKYGLTRDVAQWLAEMRASSGMTTRKNEVPPQTARRREKKN